MKRWMTYLLLLTNIIMFIAIAISLVLDINAVRDTGSFNTSNDSFIAGIIIIVVALIISTVVLGIYLFLVKKHLKDRILFTNPKIVSAIKNTAYLSILNITIPFIISIFAFAGVMPLDDDSKWLLIAALIFNLIGTVVVMGVISYLSLKIAINDIKLQAKEDEKEAKLVKRINDDETIKSDLKATSGSFGNKDEPLVTTIEELKTETKESLDQKKP